MRFLRSGSRLTGNFWLRREGAGVQYLSNRGALTAGEKQLTMRVFTGLTMLDTIRAPLVRSADSRPLHER